MVFFMQNFGKYLFYAICLLASIFALSVPPQHWLPFQSDFPYWFISRPIGLQIVEAPLFVIAVIILALSMWTFVKVKNA